MGLANRAVRKLIEKPMINVALSAYKQGKSDTDKGEYDEDSFKKQVRDLIKKQF